jgi:hypothetical protein
VLAPGRVYGGEYLVIPGRQAKQHPRVTRRADRRQQWRGPVGPAQHRHKDDQSHASDLTHGAGESDLTAPLPDNGGEAEAQDVHKAGERATSRKADVDAGWRCGSSSPGSLPPEGAKGGDP